MLRYDYGPLDDIWEPTTHLPHIKMVSYDKEKKLRIPYNTDHAIDHWEDEGTTLGRIIGKTKQARSPTTVFPLICLLQVSLREEHRAGSITDRIIRFS